MYSKGKQSCSTVTQRKQRTTTTKKSNYVNFIISNSEPSYQHLQSKRLKQYRAESAHGRYWKNMFLALPLRLKKSSEISRIPPSKLQCKFCLKEAAKNSCSLIMMPPWGQELCYLKASLSNMFPTRNLSSATSNLSWNYFCKTNQV